MDSTSIDPEDLSLDAMPSIKLEANSDRERMDEADLESRDDICSSDLAFKCKAIGLISAKVVGENNNNHSSNSKREDGECKLTATIDSHQADADSSDSTYISNKEIEAEFAKPEEAGICADIDDRCGNVDESPSSNDNGEGKDEKDSISLSTLISTIIKGTVANVDVGKNLPTNQAMGESIQTHESDDEQQENESENEIEEDMDAQESESPLPSDKKDKPEVVEQSEIPQRAYNFRRGYGRRGRPQERFTMMRSRSSRLAHELPQMETIHSEQGRFYRCVSCKVSFNFEQDMRMHLQTHLRPRYFCPVCSRRFLNQSTMERHMVTHDQNKPYVCSVCSQGFRIKSNLHRHFQRLHNKTGDKPARRGRPRGTSSASQSESAAEEYEEESPEQNFEEQRRGGENPVDESLLPLNGAQSAILENKQYQPISAASSTSLRHPEPISELSDIYRNPPHAAPSMPDPDILDHGERRVDFHVENNISEKRGPAQSIPGPNTADQRRRFAFPPADMDHLDRSTLISRGNGTSGENVDTSMLPSRYPDMDRAVDAIRRIETERLFHQELLIEELKLRKKYGLSIDGVLDHLRNEVSIQEKLGALEAYHPSRVYSTTKPPGHPLASLADESDPFRDFPRGGPPYPPRDARPVPQKRPPDYDPVFLDPLGRRETVQSGGRSAATDPYFRPHNNSAELLPVSTHLREMVNQRMMSQYRSPPPETRANNRFNSYPPGPFRPPIRNDIPNRPPYGQSLPMPPSDWKPPQSPMTRPSMFGRPMRGRRRLASMPPVSLSSLPPYSPAASASYPRSSPASPLTRPSSAGASPPSTSHVVHHRPVVAKGPTQALPPPPLQYPPPIPGTAQPRELTMTLPSPPSAAKPLSPPHLTISATGPPAKRQRDDFPDPFLEEFIRYSESDLSINPQAPPRLSPYLRALSPDRARLTPFGGNVRGPVDKEMLDQRDSYGSPSTSTLDPDGKEPPSTKTSSNTADVSDSQHPQTSPSGTLYADITERSKKLVDDTPLDLSTKS